MSECDRIADELSRAIGGDPWYGASVEAILRGVTTKTAAARPHAGVHSIWEILRHMTAWTAEVHRRLDGHPPGEPQDGDWPAPSGDDAAAWSQDVAALLDAHERLLKRVATVADAALHANPAEARDAPTGSGVSRYVLLHGLAQHHAYHAGQMALLKKMLS
jgi:uncharacterized damage-inducible protein DinB